MAMLKLFRAAAAKATDEVAKIRAKLAELRAERESVEHAPLARDEALAQLDGMIGVTAGAFAEKFPVGWFIHPADAGALARLIGGEGAKDTTDRNFAAWLLADLLRQRLTAEIDAAYAVTPPGLPAAQRKRRLAELDAQTLDAECAEERLIVEAEQAGMAIDRRGDADPRAFLEVA